MLHRVYLLAVAFTFCLTALAQNTSLVVDPANAGSITGSVTSMTNAPIANARVELRDISTGTMVASTYSQSTGKFEFNNIPNSSYEIVAVSGLAQTSERLIGSKANNYVELRLSVPDADNSANSTVSVAALKVPDKARKEFNKAAEAYDKHKPVEKINEHLARALQIYPRFAQALTLKAVLLIEQSNFADAKPLLQESIDSDASYPVPYVAMASILTFEQKYDDSVRTLERAVPLAPTMWQIYFEMGKALLAKGDFERSLRNINKAESLNPERYNAVYLLKAHALLGLKNYHAAINQLQQFLQGAPSGPDSDRARNVLRQTEAFVSQSTAVAVASH